jgi:hypothetical protein
VFSSMLIGIVFSCIVFWQMAFIFNGLRCGTPEPHMKARCEHQEGMILYDYSLGYRLGKLLSKKD